MYIVELSSRTDLMTNRAALTEHLTKYAAVHLGWGRQTRNRCQAMPSREDRAAVWLEQHQTFSLPLVVSEEAVAWFWHLGIGVTVTIFPSQIIYIVSFPETIYL